MHDAASSSVQLLDRARGGDRPALGDLLARYRSYLKLLARVQIGCRLQGKVGSSDLVQEAFVEAHRNLPLFRGTTEAEFAAWLRQILAGRLALLFRHYLGTKGRDVRLERELAREMDQSSVFLDHGFVDNASPSGQAARREQSVRLADALDRLPEHYREVIVLRHLKGLSFAEVARRMDRSEDSVQKLWVRGLAELRRRLGSDL
jgi:RNA polymerase sigma-70 factor (ECF subfamily)